MSGLTWTPLTCDLDGGVAAGVAAEGGVDEAEAGERLVAQRLEVDGGQEAVVDGGQREAEAVDGDLDAAGGGIDADRALEAGAVAKTTASGMPSPSASLLSKAACCGS